MITLRSEGFRPELPESASFPSSFGAPLDVSAEPGAATTPVDLTVLVTEVPPFVKTTTLVTIWVMLLTGFVEAGDTGPGVVDELCEEEIISVALWVAAVDRDSDSESGLSLDVKVDEGSSSDGEVEVDAGSGLSDVAGEDSGVSLAGIEEVTLVRTSEEAGMDETDVELAEAPVPLGTICRYRRA